MQFFIPDNDSASHMSHMSFSIYISVLAATDSVCLILGKSMILFLD